MINIGGMYNKECLNDMYEYDTITKSWKQVQYANAAPLPRYGHSMDIIDHKLYIFGGYCFDGKKYYYTNSTLIFDLRSFLYLQYLLIITIITAITTTHHHHHHQHHHHHHHHHHHQHIRYKYMCNY